MDHDAAPAVLDLTVLRSFSGGDRAAEQELVDIFLTQAIQRLKLLAAHCVEGPSTPWTETAHLLKGSSSVLGALTLQGLCARAEEMADGTGAARKALFAEIEGAFAGLCAALELEGLRTKREDA